MKKIFLLSALFLSFALSTMAQKSPQLIIFETDMGNDIDDAMAYDLLCKYQDMGKIKLLAVMSNKSEEFSPKYIDIMNTWYGYPNIPIGVVRNGYAKPLDNYGKKVTQMNCFKQTLSDYSSLPDAEKLYRKILSKQADHSVIVISTGFSTNLARLLDTKADEYSKLTGSQLLEKKVKYFSVMAGSFSKKGYQEYNVICDVPSCAKFFAECPVPIVVSPFELGEAICYPATSIENDFKWAPKHPMVEGYKVYLPMPHNRPTWDVTSVLEVLEPGKYMNRSEAGNIFVDDEGHTYFTPSMDGKHYYLTITPEQGETINKYFQKILPLKPKSQK